MKYLFCILFTLTIFGCCGPGIGQSSDYDFHSLEISEKAEEQIASDEGQSKLIVGYPENGSYAIAESIKYQIGHDRKVNEEFALPHELFKAGSFHSEDMVPMDDFEISVGMLKSENELGVSNYDLGINLKGPDISILSRSNLVLTYCIDVSRGMSGDLGYSPLTTQSKIMLVKEGLKASLDQMKNGDVVNIVLYDDQNISVLVEQYMHGSSDLTLIINQIDSITTSNAWAVDSGLKKAYDIAQQYFDSNKKNRVVLIFDNDVNFNNITTAAISRSTTLGNSEGILLSVLGFNYEYPTIKEFTQAGLGNYYIASIDSDMEHIFSKGFLPLLLKFASNLKIEISYPSTLNHSKINLDLSDVPLTENTGIDFSYNSSQYYLERFTADSISDLLNSEIKITISYTVPNTSAKKIASKSFQVSDLLNNETDNIKDAISMVLLTDLIGKRKYWDDILWALEHVLFEHNTVQYKVYRHLMYQFANREIKE